jgi:hypothetical protein
VKSSRPAEISNWTGKAIAVPGTELDLLLKRDELDKAGIFILTGNDPLTNAPRSYIGETEVIRCEWGHEDYSLQVENLPKAPPKPRQQEMELVQWQW